MISSRSSLNTRGDVKDAIKISSGRTIFVVGSVTVPGAVVAPKGCVAPGKNICQFPFKK